MSNEDHTSTSVGDIPSDGCASSEPKRSTAIDETKSTRVAPVPADGAPTPESVPTEGENTIGQPDRLHRHKQE